MRSLGRGEPGPDDYFPTPSSRSFAGGCGRRRWQPARSAVEATGEQLFVKPAGARKRFTGTVLAGPGQWPLDTLAGRLAVWYADVVTWQAEHRAFVADGRLVGLRHYFGDPAAVPDPDVAAAMVDAYTTAPAGYAIDVGVPAGGTTELIEVNDGYSLGRYGLDAYAYLTVLAARWRQLAAPT